MCFCHLNFDGMYDVLALNMIDTIKIVANVDHPVGLMDKYYSNEALNMCVHLGAIRFVRRRKKWMNHASSNKISLDSMFHCRICYSLTIQITDKTSFFHSLI